MPYDELETALNHSGELYKELDQKDAVIEKMKLAISALYYGAHWYPDRNVDAVKLWTDLRDAAGLEPGKTTEILGSPRGPLTAP